MILYLYEGGLVMKKQKTTKKKKSSEDLKSSKPVTPVVTGTDKNLNLADKKNTISNFEGFTRPAENSTFKLQNKFNKPNFARPHRVMNVRSFGGHR